MRNLRMIEVVRPLRYAALAAFLLCLFMASGASAQVNDNLADAQLITGVIGSVTNSSVGATKETGEPNHGGSTGGASIWYYWTAPVNGIVTFTTIGSGVPNTLLGVYKGESFNDIASVAQNDDVDVSEDEPDHARVKFYATAGTVYKIAVDGVIGDSGDIVLNWYYYHGGVFRFTESTYVVAEIDNASPRSGNMGGHTGARITVTREKGYNGAVRVACEVTDSLSGVPQVYTVFFKDYQMSAAFTAPVPDDDEVAEDPLAMSAQIISVEFDAVEGAYTNDIVAPSIHPNFGTAQFQILDDDPVGPTFVIERTHVFCNEGVGDANVWVWRVGPLDSCSVKYRIDWNGGDDQNNIFTTRSGSDYATPDANGHLSEPDYTPVSGTLTWAQGDPNPKVISIPINNDATPEFNEDFIVQLHDPSQNAYLSPVRNCVVTILADDQPAGAVDRNHLKDFDLGTTPVNNATPGANKTVYAIAVQPDSKTIIGGDFTAFNTTPRVRLARMLSNGQLDTTFNPGTGADSFVTSLALDSGGRVIAGGAFTSINGIQRYGVARLTTSGAVDTEFKPGLGTDDVVWSVAVLPDDRVLIAGSFTSYNATNRNYIARLNTDGSLDTTFDPGVGPDASVFAVIPQPDGKVIIGGDFTMVNGFVRNHIARLNTDGTLDETFDPNAGIDGTVYALALQGDGKILAGGDFRNVDLRSRSGIARLNMDGSIDTAFDPGTGTDDTVYSIVLQPDGKPIIAGIFTMFNQTRRVGIARLHTDGLLDTSFMDSAYNHFAGIPNHYFNPDLYPRNYIFTLGLQNDGNVMIGGGFTKVGGGEVDSRVDPLFDRTQRRMMMRTRSNVARLIGNSTMGPGNLHFASETFTADENDSRIFIDLVRTNGNLGQIAASFHPNSRVSGPGAAVFGTDFTFTETYGGNPTGFGRIKVPTYPTSYRIGGFNNTWMKSHGVYGQNNIGDTVKASLSYIGSADDLYITVPRDGSIEGDELANFELMVPQGTDIFYLGRENIPLGAALGRNQATFTVVDKDVSPGTIGFCSPTYTINESGGTATITVCRTNGSTGTVTVQYFTTNGPAPSAIANSDYTTRSGTLTFRPGEMTRSFTIPIASDSAVEPDENVGIRLYNVTGGAQLGITNAVLTIIDDDFAPGRLSLSATNFTVAENGNYAAIAVTRNGGNAGVMTIQYETYDVAAPSGSDQATANVDYVLTNGVLNWDSGDTATKFIFIPILNDQLIETNASITNEVFGIRLFNPSVVGSIALSSVTNALVTITEDDAYGAVHFNSQVYTVAENGGWAAVTVLRSGGVAEAVTVNFSTQDGVGTVAGFDYVATNGTLNFAPGELSKTFSVRIEDNTDENPPPHRFVVLNLTSANPDWLTFPSQAILNIVDNESFNEPAGSVDSLFNSSAGANGFIYSLALQSDGKLLLGGDFTMVNGLTRNRIARLETNGVLDTRFSAPSLGANEAIRTMISLTNASGLPDRVVIGGAFTTVNGTNRNYIARLNLDGSLDATFNPGSGANNPVYGVLRTYVGGARKYVVGGAFTTFNGVPRNGVVRLNDDGSVDSAFNSSIGVNGVVYAVAVQVDGKILIGGDFTTVDGVPRNRIARLNLDGSLDTTFNPGSGADNTVRAITVQYDGKILLGGLFLSVNGSSMPRVARLNPNGSLDLAFAVGSGFDDAVYVIALQLDGKILVGGEFTMGSGVTRNRLTRLNPDGTVDPTINFGTGANSFVAALAVQTDGKIVLSGGFSQFDGVPRSRLARLYGSSLQGVGNVEFTAAQFQVSETATNAVITLRRRGGTESDPQGNVSINFATSDINATAGEDYVMTVTNVVFPTGETFRSIPVPLLDDSLIEGDEFVQLTLSIPPSGLLEPGNQSTAILKITSDDSAISFVDSVFRGQENSINGAVLINLVRAGSSATPATVDLLTSGTGTATPSLDYGTINTTISFAVGETNKSVGITLFDDTDVEGDETFGVHLANVNGAFLLAPSTATVTIVDNDFAPGSLAFAMPAFSVSESATNAVITIVRTNGSTGSAAVNFATSNGSATAGLDYTAVSGTLVFADGEVSKSFSIPLAADDLIVEGPLTVNLILSNPTGGATIAGPASVTLTILDNDVGLAFSSPAYVVTEGASVNVTVVRQNGSNGVLTVNYATAPANPTNAVAGTDYTATAGTLTFANGELIKTFTVSTLEDTLVEGNETFRVLLSNATGGAQLVNPTNAVVTIVDNDSAFSFSSATYSVSEGATNAVITVFRTNANTGTVTVNYATSPAPISPATSPSDYGATSGTLTFLDGETVKTFMIPIFEDTLVEGNERITLSLSAPSQGTQLGAITTATLTILDNDAGVMFSSATYTVQEHGVGATITVLRTNFTGGIVTIDYSTVDGAAQAGSDYQNTSGTLVFTNGETSKTFTVPIIDDTLEEGNETILLKLANLTGSASLLNPSAATLTIFDNDGSVVVPAGSQLISEVNGTVNGHIDINETVTILFAFRNTGTNNTTNLVATLMATNGVTVPSASQNYGAMVASGPSVSRPFTFTATGTNGGRVTATFQLQDGPVNIGRVTFSYILGISVNRYTNANAITVVDNAAANPYPSTIQVSGVAGSATKVTVTLTNLSHGFPDDLDILLVGPSEQKTMLMSDSGGGTANALNNVTLTFDDGAASVLPDASLITSGSYKPTDFLINADLFAGPAPVGPYPASLAVFNGSNPNGTWSLYVSDDTAMDSGMVANGWILDIMTSSPLTPFCDLSLTAGHAPDVAIISNSLNFTITVTNHGPSTATGVILTNSLPANATLLSAAVSQGSYSTNQGNLIYTVGTLAKDGTATLTFSIRPNTIGSITNSVVAIANETDPNTDNNVQVDIIEVNPAAADLLLIMSGNPNPLSVYGVVTYTVIVTNAGPALATSVSVTNTLPTGVTDLALTASQGTSTVIGDMVIFSIGSISNRATAVLEISVRATSEGTLTNAATVGSPVTDPLKGNNSVSVKTVVEPPRFITSLSGNSLTISWPAEASGYVLETASDLTPPVSWTPVTDPVPEVVDGENTISVNTSTGARYFRLRRD